MASIRTPASRGVETAQVDAANRRQRAAHRLDRIAIAVQKPRPQRCRHADAAVVGGAAADADDQVGHIQIQRRRDQFASALGRGQQRD